MCIDLTCTRSSFFLIWIGIYFGKPRGFKNENDEEVGFNTEVYAAHEVNCLMSLFLTGFAKF